MTFLKKWAHIKRRLGLGRPATNSDKDSEDKYQRNRADTDRDPYSGLSEVAAPPPMQNEDENARVHVHHTLEER